MMSRAIKEMLKNSHLFFSLAQKEEEFCDNIENGKDK